MGHSSGSVDALPPTSPEPASVSRLRHARALRRAALAVLAVFVLLGLTGLLGVRSSTVVARGEGYELTVTYGSVTRAGLATPFSVEVRRPGGFAGPVVIAVSSSYLEIFDENGLDPDPSEATATRDQVEWTFDAPSGDVLGVSFDARVEPGVQWGREGFAAVLVDGRPVARSSFRTWVMP